MCEASDSNVLILQLADFHLAEYAFREYSYSECAADICQIIKKHANDTKEIVIAVCGDLTSKGKDTGYMISKSFLRILKDTLEFETSILMCPGNHDINTDAIAGSANPFAEFNLLSWQLGAQRPFDIANSVHSHVVSGIHFVRVNSSFHLDYESGKVAIDKLISELSKFPELSKIVMVHHHSISTENDGNSCIRNAHEFLQVCISKNVSCILHGHNHMETVMSIGQSSVRLIGVPSLFLTRGDNYNNQFNLIHFSSGHITSVNRFRYHADLPGDNGEQGCFKGSLVEFI